MSRTDRFETVVRFAKWPYPYEALVAELANDKDVAGGVPVSGLLFGTTATL